ncbi:hypothetical protein [Peribacillus asahii]|uniref:hypothetical protein n=1 Tax=Peribacillus asahii TaxID=228899 RepID=UPI00381A0196
MKDIINLQGLKRSRSKKHHTIYEKAHRIMRTGIQTPDMTEEEVIMIAEGFPTLSIRVFIGGDIFVRSVKDEWMIRDEGRFYTLYHKSNIFDKGRIKDSFHIQDIFKDLSYIFASIVSHDEFALGIRQRNAYEVSDLIQA